MKKFIAMFLAIASASGLCACSGGNAGNTKPEEPIAEEVYEFKERDIKTDGQTYTDGLITYPAELWQTPEYEYCTDLDFGGVGNVKGIFYTSPIKRNGKKTKIAAYIGLPDNIEEGKKVPAIVLVHGGLGTAIPDWVKYWNDMGFAAISIDTEGAEPIKGVSNYNNVHIPENRYKDDAVYTNGPTNNGFSDYNLPMEEQWMYHATSATILACSLISSFKEVDAQKIGITGISWGGMITNIVVGYDDRFSFAIPVYGALSLTESCSGFKTIYNNAEGSDISAKRWDTLEPLKQTHCKVFEVNGTKDTAFSFDASSRCAEAANGFSLFKSNFTHGQEYGAYESNIPYFAKYFCGMESEFIEVIENPTATDPEIKLRKYGEVTPESITIMYTASDKTDKYAAWKKRNVKVVDGIYSYKLNVPSEAKFYYVSVVYNTNLEVSSRLVAL